MRVPFKQVPVGAVFEMNGFTYQKVNKYSARRFSPLTGEYFSQPFTIDPELFVTQID